MNFSKTVVRVVDLSGKDMDMAQRFDIGSSTGRILTTGKSIGLCPTEGKCLDKKWALSDDKAPWLIDVEMWKHMGGGHHGNYNVMLGTVCADIDCRKPITLSEARKINDFLENMTPREESEYALDFLLDFLTKK